VSVSSIRTQTGTVPSAQVLSYSLSSTGRLTNSTFGQASLDATNDTLYITENGDSSTQIWVVTGASTQTQNAVVALQSLQIGGDTGGPGSPRPMGGLWLHGEWRARGPQLADGPRIRKGTASAFDPNSNQVIVGSQSDLGIYGSLAYDTGDTVVFAARHNTDSVSTAQPIDVFTTGQFNQGPYQTPNMQLGVPRTSPRSGSSPIPAPRTGWWACRARARPGTTPSFFGNRP